MSPSGSCHQVAPPTGTGGLPCPGTYPSSEGLVALICPALAPGECGVGDRAGLRAVDTPVASASLVLSVPTGLSDKQRPPLQPNF